MSLTCPSLQILGKTQIFLISGQSLINENCHNCRTSYDLDMKLGPVTKLDNRNTVTSKKLTMTSWQQIVTSLFFWFMANLLQYGSRILPAWSVKLTSSLIVTLYVTKTENRTKNLLHSSHTIALSKGTFLPKNTNFLHKKSWQQQNYGGLGIKRYIFWN